MKLESEPGFGVQTPPRKSYNPFDSDDEDTNGFVKGNINTYDIRSFEKNDDSLTFHLDNTDLSWEEAILSHSQILSQTVPKDGEEVLFRKDTQLFTDKTTVMECELPELMVCYKENGYNSVKDIGVDEGVPTHDKVSIKRRDTDESKSNLSSFQAINGDSMNGELTLGSEHQELPAIEGLKSRSENNLGKDDLTRVDGLEHDLSEEVSDSSCLTKGDDTKTGVMVHDLSDKQLKERDEMSYIKAVEKGNGSISEEEEHDREDDVSVEHLEESSTKPSVMNVTEAIIESSKSCPSEEEGTSPQSSEPQVSEESPGSSVANALSYNSKVESGSIILDFNSSSTALPEKDNEVKEKSSQQNEMAVVEKPPQAQTMSRHGDEGGGFAAPGGSFAALLGTDKGVVNGETSFSVERTPPASITYMEPHVRNGSISMRSESSAGSTRSFAFPVLQAEWNSSPVRMTKAEQRHIRKHRGWVHSVMCCRF